MAFFSAYYRKTSDSPWIELVSVGEDDPREAEDSCRGTGLLLYLAKVLDGSVDIMRGSWVVLPVSLRPVGAGVKR